MIKTISKTWSSWETSFSGGFLQTLFRHPNIEAPKEVYIKPIMTSSRLYHYEVVKLCNIFLYCSTQNIGSIDTAFHPLKTRLVFDAKQCNPIVIIEMHGDKKKNLLDRLNDLSPLPEAVPMLNHYREYIIDSEIGIEISIPNECKAEFMKALNESQKESEHDKIMDALSQLGMLESLSETLSKSLQEGKFKERGVSGYNATDPELLNKTRFLNPDDDGIHSYNYGSDNCTIKVKDIIGIKKTSDSLVRRLDISFDPRRDVIKSVKQGKLDAGKIATVLCGQLDVYQRTEDNQVVKPFKVVMLGDESGSMGHNIGPHSRVDFQKSYIKAFYDAFSQLMSEEDIFVYGHSGDATPEIYIYKEPGVYDFDRRLEYMKERCENYDGPALEKLYDRIRAFTKDAILLLYFSDGLPAGHSYGGEAANKDLKRVSEKCKRDDFVVVGLGIGGRDMADMYHFHTNIDKIEPAIKTINQAIKQVFC